MPIESTFESWLGSLLNYNESQIKTLLEDKVTLHFLIAWSIFESKCFAGFLKAEQLRFYAQKYTTYGSMYVLPKIQLATEHFYNRYQNKELLKNLLNQKRCKELENLLQQQFSTLNNEDRLFLLLYVIYRFRNNIFHGNKKIQNWTKYHEEIQHCTNAMQIIISQAESLNPSLLK